MTYGQPFYTYPNAGYTPMQQQPYNMYQGQAQMPTMAQNQPINGYQQQPQMPTQQAVPPKTNVPFATSLMDAMSRTTDFNSDTFYADQDKPFIYRISIDMQGRKTYKTFEIKDVTEQVIEQGSQVVSPAINLSEEVTERLKDYATKDDLKAFRDEIMNYAISLGIGAQAQVPASVQAQSAIQSPQAPRARRASNRDIEE